MKDDAPSSGMIIPSIEQLQKMTSVQSTITNQNYALSAEMYKQEWFLHAFSHFRQKDFHLQMQRQLERCS